MVVCGYCGFDFYNFKSIDNISEWVIFEKSGDQEIKVKVINLSVIIYINIFIQYGVKYWFNMGFI